MDVGFESSDMPFAIAIELRTLPRGHGERGCGKKWYKTLNGIKGKGGVKLEWEVASQEMYGIW